MKHGFRILMWCLVPLLASSACAAMPSYSEAVAPQGDDAAIQAEWKGETADGAALLPVPAKGVLGEVTVAGGTAGKAEVTKIQGESVLRVPVEGAAGPVSVTVAWKVPGLFKKQDKGGGDEGPSGRGDLAPVLYAIRNSTGQGFDKAALTLKLPRGMRLFQVNTKGAKFAEKDGTYTISRSLSGKDGAPGMGAGARLDLDLSMMPAAGSGAFVWFAVIVLSILFLYVKRDAMPGRAAKEEGKAEGGAA